MEYNVKLATDQDNNMERKKKKEAGKIKTRVIKGN